MITAEEAKQNVASYKKYFDITNKFLDEIDKTITGSSLSGLSSCDYIVQFETWKEWDFIIRRITSILTNNGFHVDYESNNDISSMIKISWREE